MTTAVDVSDLGRLNAHDGPYLSAYIPLDTAGDQWRQLRTDLEADGAPDAALALVDGLVAQVSGQEGTLAVIADETTVYASDHIRDTFIYSRGQWAGAADLVPLIKERQERMGDPTSVAERTVALLEQCKAGPSVDGIRATVEAMNRAEVEVLLVRDDRDERHNVPHEDAAVVDALVRDAIATGATVWVIPASGPVTEGVGALLR